MVISLLLALLGSSYHWPVADAYGPAFSNNVEVHYSLTGEWE